MKKSELRLKALAHLINTHQIEDQETLVHLLKHSYNINVNQSMISRDLRTLGVAKRTIDGKQIYEMDTIDVHKEILRSFIIHITHNESMIVIKTLPGLAAFVADYLDVENKLHILGTLAGENTVFITPESTKTIADVFKKVCIYLHVKQTLHKE